MNDHELDELLASMAPITDDEVASARLGPVAEAMRGAIMTGTHQGGDYGDVGARPSRRNRRTTRMEIVATTAAVLLGGTQAAALLVEARTCTRSEETKSELKSPKRNRYAIISHEKKNKL